MRATLHTMRLRLACLLSAACGLYAVHGPVHTQTQTQTPATLPASPQQAASLSDRLGAAIGAAVRAQMDAGAMPGAVVLIGNEEGVQFKQAYGWRASQPEREAMSTDTVFDLASLTKAVATTTAVMQLVERGRLKLDAPVARYWPAFAANGKRDITVAQLLAHTSGLRPDLDSNPPWTGYQTGLHKVIAEKPQTPPGTRMVYSDINFIVLGELVQRVSQLSLPDYAERHIFHPLGMRDTRFLPPAEMRQRIAPTELRGDGSMMRGTVHDPFAHRMGGWAGHAGLFGTADDLARFAHAMLHVAAGDAQPNRRQAQPARAYPLLRAETLNLMMQRQSPAEQSEWRGLGWSLDAPWSPQRETLPPLGLIGHTGYTGTGLWIDLLHKQYLIILSNRVHPRGLGDARPLRRQIQALLSATHPVTTASTLADRLPALQEQVAQASSPGVNVMALPAMNATNTTVMTGIDVLRSQHYSALTGQRLGLITNLSAVDSKGWRTLDRLSTAPGLQLRKVFTPEHGLNRDQEGQIASGTDAVSGLPLISLYGKQLRPTPDMLQGLDTLVFDMQDAGARFYTYISTMGEAMQAAAQAGLNFVVLDRPNPVIADRVSGPVLDADLRSFTAFAELPVQHGMTLGEIARWLRDDIRTRTGLEVKLQVIGMQGYKRPMRFEQTGLDWVPPSPNLRTPTTALLYPGVAWVEGANISVGRGTDKPFEWVGAPWVDADKLVEAMNADKLPGLTISMAHFTPASGPYQNQLCHGVQFRITQRDQFDAQLLGLSLTRQLRLQNPSFQIDKTLGMIGSRDTLARIKAGQSQEAIAQSWQDRLRDFMTRRATYLLY
ncbi:MAG TPA: serine hydrolase [Aquabacterium sp.]|uniref:serine hydrolase n=1 Tax=Aquabacterium sp. TaxID=1872578 RepID=UPI002E34E5E6|nr:serine hydrolase [Aquabacterium sp.]HEX5357315.1 serine hydrolase [Aquabacterium sp.]